MATQRQHSLRSACAKHLIENAVEYPRPHPTPQPTGPNDPQSPPTKECTPVKGTVGIIGAGLAGLYSAMILQDLGYDYVILEADPKRVGGRAFTHYFSDTPYDYFDVGAMRFPDIPWHDRVFKLFDQVKVKRIPYYLTANNTVLYYNGLQHPVGEQQEGDVFNVSVSRGGVVPDSFMDFPPEKYTSPDQFFNDVAFNPLTEPFAALNDIPPGTKDFATAFAKLWSDVVSKDAYSSHGFMLAEAEYPQAVVEWLETMTSATGSFNGSVVESVLTILDFGWPDADTDPGCPAASSMQAPTDCRWFCIDGGASCVPNGMLKYLKKKKPVYFDHRVTSIAIDDPETGSLKVKVAGGSEHKFAQVICTVPLPCLRTIDTSTLRLSYQQHSAIRSLQYRAATKIGIKFPSRWWETLPKPIFGGVSKTDLPARAVVYPSYGLQGPQGPHDPSLPGVLLASYTSSQDARSLEALSGAGAGYSGNGKILVDGILNDLATVHGISVQDMGTPIDAFSWSWHSDVNSRGAFARFSPGQWLEPYEQEKVVPMPMPGPEPLPTYRGKGQSLFASLTAPNPTGTFHIAGEATSVHHAWFLGALNSAWRAVFNVLTSLRDDEGIARLKDLYQIPDEFDDRNLSRLHKCAREGQLW